MANDVFKKAFYELLETYLSLGNSTETTVRFLKKTPNVETRSKLVAELRSLDKKRLELLDQMDNLGKST
jgi:di/tripeptidase